MKLFLLFILMFSLKDTIAQHLTASGGMERTVAGTESQFQTGYENKKLWSAGIFYQLPITIPPFETRTNSASWYGIYLNAPLARAGKVNFYAQLRTGLSVDKFLICVPSLETRIRLTRSFAVEVGSSIRHTYPAFLCRLQIHLFNNSSNK